MKHWISLILVTLLVACGTKGPVRGTDTDVAALSASLRALSPDVDPAEAYRAAALTYETTHRLAIEYQITDPALIHNAKVNAGQRPRGLCYHWAEDLQAALDSQGFETLDTSRAIANAENPILIDHSTTIIVAKGAPMESGVVVDPWRYAGRLFWAPVLEDTRYDWRPRMEVLRQFGRIRYVQRTEGSLAPLPVE